MIFHERYKPRKIPISVIYMTWPWIYISCSFRNHFWERHENGEDCRLLHPQVSHGLAQLVVLSSTIYVSGTCSCFWVGRAPIFCFLTVTFRSSFSESSRKRFMVSWNSSRGSGPERGGQLQISRSLRAYREEYNAVPHMVCTRQPKVKERVCVFTQTSTQV